jgi:hypothetical protein
MGVRRVLWVRFRNGSVYTYDDVPGVTYEAMLASRSKGGFVWSVLRGYGADGPFAYQRRA